MATTIRPASTGADRAAVLFAQHGPEVLRFARRRCPDLADDILSETFAIAVRRAEDIPEGKELPWLYVVAEHVLRNQVRSQQRAQRFRDDLTLLSPGSSPAPELPVVGPALDDLPERERLLLVMTALEGLSAAEAADRMGIPYGSARNALVSGRRRLATKLAAAGVGLAAAILVALLVALPSGRRTPRAVAHELDRTITRSTAVHDVAFISRSDEPRARRYERWTSLRDDASTVRLPSGRAVTASGGESLRAAARRGSAPVGRREAAELDALELSAPDQLRAMLQDPAVRATVGAGPAVDGAKTTTFTAERTTAGGEPVAVRVVVDSDDATVLEVRSRRLSVVGEATGAATIVRFSAWEPDDDPDATPRAGLEPRTVAPTRTPAASGVDTSAASGRSRGDRLASAPPRLGTPGSGAVVKVAAAAPTGAAAPAERILRTRFVMRVGQNRPGSWGPSDAGVRGERDAWFELGGRSRSRVRTGWTDYTLHESWFTGTRAGFWTLDQWGHGKPRERASRRPLKLYGPEGGWLLEALPVIEAHAGDAGLPPGTTLTGRPALMLDAPVGKGFTLHVALDPATRTPIQAMADPSGSMPHWLQISTWKVLDAGRSATVFAPHPPRGS
ncbi:MAG: RNA polymerase sigma factor [Patulibacter minatonensis]